MNKANIDSAIVDGIVMVRVFDKNGKIIFIKPKTEQTASIAHTIYMGEKYWDRHIEAEELKERLYETRTN